ncbi:P-loop containing nucleoside triphosphate hydrolase protein [Halteromyces radiatus]|uniref:P-loop containing nucleoside triphosphate hydrolase protein n=1 Tax=Halteromyces radiatus TaxID=101107 RepID=UPI00222044C4|nr:P-loop containing nucleoside triphosphate hydrolase protein [Halteromyces radiatus]KAI8081390.1 P-loop containing nucleoside triphosphate hydrolase protein [Halteromyces radiatus]
MILRYSINKRLYTTFQRLGISQSTTDHLNSKFGINKPTAAQTKFIPAILTGNDLYLRDATGTGKSFGMALTLASQPSCHSLYIAPNQELASQINDWLQQLSPSCGHVVVDTPARLLERLATEYMDYFDRIVLDEADQALRLPKRYATLRQQQRRQLHPKPAQLVLQSLLSPSTRKKPQLIATSATLNRPLRHWLVQQGWMVDPVFIDLSNQQPWDSTQDGPVQHYCLLISEDSIRNITLQPSIPSSTVGFEDDDDRMLESVAILHDMEQVENSVLFVDTSISIVDVQARLSACGIHCKDIRQATRTDRNTLWIATEFTARGVDLPSISHVFILGKPASVASYLHMAGRTGRLGPDGIGRGKVISLVRDQGRSEAKMLNMYKLLNLPIKSLEHVE